jgi:hypothetical protein
MAYGRADEHSKKNDESNKNIEVQFIMGSYFALQQVEAESQHIFLDAEHFDLLKIQSERPRIDDFDLLSGAWLLND